jgi:hypothetical protein
LVDEYTKDYIETIIRNGLTDGGHLLFGFKEQVSSALSNEIGKFIAKQLDIEIKVKEKHEKNMKAVDTGFRERWNS